MAPGTAESGPTSVAPVRSIANNFLNAPGSKFPSRSSTTKRVADRAVISLTAALVGARIVEQVQVLVHGERAQINRDDAQRCDACRLGGEIGLLQGRLHDPDQGVAVRRQRQAFHALVGNPVGEFATAASASNGDSRPISRPVRSKCVMNGPYSSDTQNVPSGQRDQALGVVTAGSGGSTAFRSVIVSVSPPQLGARVGVPSAAFRAIVRQSASPRRG